MYSQHDIPPGLPAFEGKRIGFALTGSFCTFEHAFEQMEALAALGAKITPIMSENAYSLDTRFFSAKETHTVVEVITGMHPLHTLQEVEPIGPKGLLDLLIIAPATGNTLSKMACGIVDTPVTMAAKSQLRNLRPVLLAVSTNDGLSSCARSIGQLLATRGMLFVPYGQDDSKDKPTSLVAHWGLLIPAARHALMGKQLQPMLRDAPG